jgi:predicted kinase
VIFGAAPTTRLATLHPALIVLSGLPGSGKSHLARALAARAPVTVIGSDRVRRMLVARPTYSDDEHEFVYNACVRLARRGLAARRVVVFDATNLRRQHRQRFRDLAVHQHAPCHLVQLDCSDATVRARLQRRARGETYDGSDADERVYDLLRETVEPLHERHLRLRGDGDVHAAAEAVLTLLRPEAMPSPSYHPATWAGMTGAGG